MEIVTCLLADPRVDPAACSNAVIRAACSNGHRAVVDALLADPRVDPTTNLNDALVSASCNGHLTVVERLLADPRVDPGYYDNSAIRSAADRSRTAVVQLLLDAQAARSSFPAPRTPAFSSLLHAITPTRVGVTLPLCLLSAACSSPVSREYMAALKLGAGYDTVPGPGRLIDVQAIAAAAWARRRAAALARAAELPKRSR